MKGSRVVAAVLVFLMIVGPGSSAMAEPILYTIEFVASGAIDGVPFSDEPFVFAGVTDTTTVEAIAQANLAQLVQLITALSYVSGFVLVIVSIVKFKQHKDNPTQFWFTVDVIPPSQLTLPVVRDGAVVTVTIDSIRNNTLELRTRHVAGGL